MSGSVRVRVIGAILGALLVALVLVAGSGAAKFAAKTCTAKNKVKTCVFSYTGHPFKWVVPTGVTGVTATVFGAQGGASAHNGSGGLGGEATANLAVKPGSVLQVDVGGAGLASKGGWNGGGNGGADSFGLSTGGGGGGASDVRAGKCVAKLTCTMAQALLVAGGGGGGGDAEPAFDPSNLDVPGAPGGGLSGGSDGGGGGGTQTAGGGGSNGCNAGGGGVFGQGGAGGASYYSAFYSAHCDGGAGGGGGYYGGGGSGSEDSAASQGGGGGSGFGPGGSTRVVFASGVQTGNGSVSISWPVAKKAPTITTGASTQFPTGMTSSFTVLTGPTEWPIPKLKIVGSLPAGVTFVDKHDGTARLAGKPSGSVAGVHSFQIVASNGVGPNAVQKFTLTVGAAPQITSKPGPYWPIGSPPGTLPPQTFTITTSGDPAPAITETGPLPSGLTFKDNGNGTATISGAPNENNGPVIGAYPITLKASQPGGSSWPAATQSATVYIDGDPQYEAFTINATGTDSTPLNPGFGLAVNGTPCHNPTFPQYEIECGPGAPAAPLSYFEDGFFGGRGCDYPTLPLATSASQVDCAHYRLSWDPVDNVTISAPLTTTVGAQTYDFLYWDLSGQSVASCNGGDNTVPDCTFQVPQSGTNANAVYIPEP
jgi:hypothetical protein